jgi:hypothetical protein
MTALSGLSYNIKISACKGFAPSSNSCCCVKYVHLNHSKGPRAAARFKYLILPAAFASTIYDSLGPSPKARKQFLNAHNQVSKLFQCAPEQIAVL